MTEELEQLLKNLKLKRILEIYDEQLRAADKDDISYSDFVPRLVRAQFQARREGALEWRIQRAKPPGRWTLETFPAARQPGVNRKQIRGFAELEFIAKAENIVFVGKTAVGKTGLEPVAALLPHRRHGRPGRICSPGAGGVPRDAGHDGDGASRRPAAGGATASTWPFAEGHRKCIGAGRHASPDSAVRSTASGHDSLPGLFPACHRGSAGVARQPGVLRVSPVPARTHRSTKP